MLALVGMCMRLALVRVLCTACPGFLDRLRTCQLRESPSHTLRAHKERELRVCLQVSLDEAGTWLASIALAPLAWLALPQGLCASSCGPAQAMGAHELAAPPASAACGSTSQASQAADPALHPGPDPGCRARPAPAADLLELGPGGQNPDPEPDPDPELRAAVAALDALAAMAAGLTATGPPAMRANTAQRLLAGLDALLAAPGGGGARAEAACAMHRRDIARAIASCAMHRMT